MSRFRVDYRVLNKPLCSMKIYASSCENAEQESLLFLVRVGLMKEMDLDLIDYVKARAL